MSATGKIFGAAGMKLLNDLMDAKETGQPLPPFLDKVAAAAVKSKGAIADAAIQTAKDEANKRIAWIVAGGLAITLAVVMLRK